MIVLTVYVELVFIENFIVDYFLLLAASKITFVPYKHAFWGATFGALYASVMPVFYSYAPFLQRILVLFGMCAITFTLKSFKNLIYVCSALSACSACLFGIINLIFGEFVEGILYAENLLFILMLCSCFSAYLLFRLIIPLINEKKLKSANCKLYINENVLNAFIDSGNSLYYNSTPVVLVNKEALKDYGSPIKPLIIPYSAIKTSGALIGFKPESVRIYYENNLKEINCIVALCDHKFNNKFDALMHPDLIKECV